MGNHITDYGYIEASAETWGLFLLIFRLERDKGYYQNFLHDKETELLDSVGDILQIELLLYDLRKLYLRTFELEEEGLEVGRQLRAQEERLRRLLSVEQTHLTDLELDIAHAKFMIDFLNKME